MEGKTVKDLNPPMTEMRGALDFACHPRRQVHDEKKLDYPNSTTKKQNKNGTCMIQSLEQV